MEIFGMRKLFTFILALPLLALAACSTNPATGQSQFTALMSPAQENEVGAQEHEKVIAQFGLYENKAVQDYVSAVGRKVVVDTERPDVEYKFFVIDSPIVNAFALPGGYIYVSRGLLALANNEAELASVLGHEAGHITGRHSAERYSRSVVTSLGTSILSAAIGQAGVSQALGLGSDLYLKSYSRSQENEADTLGIRYMSRAGYDPHASTAFLQSLQDESALDAKIKGDGAPEASYFSTHPATADRVEKTRAEVANLPAGVVNRDEYLQHINGMVYGDSSRQGFARGQDFYHPGFGFTFKAPQGYEIVNTSNEVVMVSKKGAAAIFDMAGRENGMDALTYMTQVWMVNEKNLKSPERIKINGMNAAAAGFSGTVNGQLATIRLVAIEWSPGLFARFQIAIPSGTSAEMVDDLKRTTYSFRAMSAEEKRDVRPYTIQLIEASGRDTAASLARKMPFSDFQLERFSVLNGLPVGAAIEPGRRYKIIMK